MFAQKEAENRQREPQQGTGPSIINPEALALLITAEFPQQSARPTLAQGTPAPTSQRSASAIDSAPQRESPIEVAQSLSRSFGQRFASGWPLIAGLAAVLAMAGVSLYALVYLVVPPPDEKPAATTAPTLKAAPTVPADTPATAITNASATSADRAPEFPATNSMPAPVKPPDETTPIVTAAPGSIVPGTASTVPSPAPTKPPEEAAPIVAVAPGAFAPGTAPAVTMPAPTGPPESLRASTAEISALLARGDSLFGVGDIASARLFYERATDAGDAQAALRLGETYDPFFLALARLKVVRGDLAVATRWYRRARDLGASEAEILLKRIENR